MTARPYCRKLNVCRGTTLETPRAICSPPFLTWFGKNFASHTKLNQCLRAGMWMAAAAILGLFAALLVAQAAVFALASAGLALYWSCLLVAAILAALAAIAFCAGQVGMSGDLSPARTVRQFNEAVRSATEQLR
jgi:hypothetical protein